MNIIPQGGVQGVQHTIVCQMYRRVCCVPYTPPWRKKNSYAKSPVDNI